MVAHAGSRPPPRGSLLPALAGCCLLQLASSAAQCDSGAAVPQPQKRHWDYDNASLDHGRRGMKMLRRGKLKTANKAFRAAVEFSAEPVTALANLGRGLMRESEKCAEPPLQWAQVTTTQATGGGGALLVIYKCPR